MKTSNCSANVTLPLMKAAEPPKKCYLKKSPLTVIQPKNLTIYGYFWASNCTINGIFSKYIASKMYANHFCNLWPRKLPFLFFVLY